MLPLSKEQTLSLIAKLNYDKQTKKRFSERVKKDLYETHSSFLSSPLLTTMMLLTFDQFADIPAKMYIFFEQAFDTLYLRHDATKEGFQRKKHTDLPIDRFKRYFSYFCLISYYDQKLEFSHSEVVAYVDKAFEANSIELTADDFVKDVVDSICVMQRDGLDVIFTHRSFQEYFTAFCLANFIQDNFYDILEQLISRKNDSVISMLLDMQRDKTEASFIIPALKKNLDAARSAKCFDDAERFIAHYECSVRIETSAKGHRIFVVGGNSDYDFISSLSRLYPDHFLGAGGFKKYTDKDGRAIRKLFSTYNIDKDGIKSVKYSGAEYVPASKHQSAFVPSHYVRDTGFGDYSLNQLTRMDNLLNVLVRRNEHARKSISSILGLGKKHG